MVDLQTRKPDSSEQTTIQPSVVSELFYSVEERLKKLIKSEFDKLDDTNLKINSNYMEQILPEVIKICQATDKEEFKIVCKDFVSKCFESGLQYGDYKDSSRKELGFRTIPILWTNGGLSTMWENFSNRDLLKQEEYFDYISDADSPPFRLLWNIVPILLQNIDQVVDKTQIEGTYLQSIRKEQGISPFNQFGKQHVPFDRPLSEVWTDCIPVEMLRHVKIEFGQHNKFHKSKAINPQNVFAKSELPIFLKRVAEYNIGLEKKLDSSLKIGDDSKDKVIRNAEVIPERINTQECIEKNSKTYYTIAGMKMLQTLNIVTMQQNIENAVREGKVLSTEDAYNIIRDFLPKNSTEDAYNIIRDFLPKKVPAVVSRKLSLSPLTTSPTSPLAAAVKPKSSGLGAISASFKLSDDADSTESLLSTTKSKGDGYERQ